MGEQKPLGKTPRGGNPSPEMTYLPTYLSCQHKSAHPPLEVREQRGLRVKGLNCEFRREGICSRRPACSGDLQLGWSYGGGQPGLIRLHGSLVQRSGAVMVLRCAD